MQAGSHETAELERTQRAFLPEVSGQGNSSGRPRSQPPPPAPGQDCAASQDHVLQETPARQQAGKGPGPAPGPLALRARRYHADRPPRPSTSLPTRGPLPGQPPRAGQGATSSRRRAAAQGRADRAAAPLQTSSPAPATGWPAEPPARMGNTKNTPYPPKRTRGRPLLFSRSAAIATSPPLATAPAPAGLPLKLGGGGAARLRRGGGCGC